MIDLIDLIDFSGQNMSHFAVLDSELNQFIRRKNTKKIQFCSAVGNAFIGESNSEDKAEILTNETKEITELSQLHSLFRPLKTYRANSEVSNDLRPAIALYYISLIATKFSVKIRPIEASLFDNEKQRDIFFESIGWQLDGYSWKPKNAERMHSSPPGVPDQTAKKLVAERLSTSWQRANNSHLDGAKDCSSIQINNCLEDLAQIKGISFSQVPDPKKQFELGFDLFLTRIERNFDGIYILLGLHEVECRIDGHRAHIAERYDCRRFDHPNTIVLTQKDTWRFTGPRDQMNWLVGNLVGVPLCFGERQPGKKSSILISVFAHRLDFSVKKLDARRDYHRSDTKDEILVNKILTIYLNKKHFKNREQIELCQSSVEWDS